MKMTMNIKIVSDLLEADMDDLLKSEKINEESLDSIYESVQNFVEREIVEESEVYDDLPVENFESNNSQVEEE